MIRTAALILLVSTLGLAQSSTAQSGPYRTGLGAVLGNPTGLTLKVYAGNSGFGSTAVDVSAAWDFNDEFAFVQAHFLWEKPLPSGSPGFRLFYGPGAFIGAAQNDDVALGASFNAGLAYWADRFEFFVQGTPRLAVVPATEFDLGAGLGVRFYF